MAGIQKILLVDDDKELINIYTDFFKRNGYNVAAAYDGDEALEQAKTFQPDLVFLDIMMPKKNGYDVLHILRHEPEYNSTAAKIALLTNLDEAIHISEEVQKDMDGYYVKADVQLEDLLGVIKSLEKA